MRAYQEQMISENSELLIDVNRSSLESLEEDDLSSSQILTLVHKPLTIFLGSQGGRITFIKQDSSENKHNRAN